MLDNHDTNRFMYYVNSKDILLDAIAKMVQQDRSFSIYYGTEAAVSNTRNIFNGEPFADLQVREPYDIAKSICEGDIRALITE